MSDMIYRKVTIKGNYYVNANFDTKGTIRINNDSALAKTLDKYSSYKVANECKWIYSTIYGEQIDIETDSIAVEIYGHYNPSNIAKILYQVPGLPTVVKTFLKDFVIKHTDRIDCGVRHNTYGGTDDYDRPVWDTIAEIINPAYKEPIVK